MHLRPLPALIAGGLATAIALSAPLSTPGSAAPAATPTATSDSASDHQASTRSAVAEVRTIGTTVRGRQIRAYRLGEANAARTVVLLGVMHGSERAPGLTLRRLRDTAQTVTRVDLWVIPVLNPDGAATGRRANARGVDLNRNFPHRWSRSVSGAGRTAASERETKAIMRFLDRVDPDVVVSLHQPFAAVDTSVNKGRGLARALSRELKLPRRDIDCGGPCRGTLTGWFNATHAGEAITVEFGPRPARNYLRRTAVRGLVAAVGGRLR
ncbi:DUF2817 domain-containing protein [Sporichthya polymorpha]|uniref:DUF2817 domain-containing protein n=1 Tax=Sporichthya polymorpha TaxID=35751 RepID=UPI0003747923|nr:DUF2817 domain-containing protein [Sporichthya polymorpha]